MVVLSHSYGQTRPAASASILQDDDCQRPDDYHRRRVPDGFNGTTLGAAKVFVPITLRSMMQPAVEGSTRTCRSKSCGRCPSRYRRTCSSTAFFTLSLSAAFAVIGDAACGGRPLRRARGHRRAAHEGDQVADGARRRASARALG